MSGRSENKEMESAGLTLSGYRYDVRNTKADEKVGEAFNVYLKEVQRFGISTRTAAVLKRMQTAVTLKRQEFHRTPWNPPLSAHPFFEYLQNLLLSMLQKVGQKINAQETKVKTECFDAICSLISIFSFEFVFDDKFLSAVEQCLTNIRENQYPPDDFHYVVLTILFDQIYTVNNFKSNYSDVYQKLYPAVTTLILQCILNYYEDEFKRFYAEEQGRTSRIDNDSKHRIFLTIFPEYILSDEEIVKPILTASQMDTLCQTLFNWSHMVFHHIFQKQLYQYTLSNVLVRFLNLMNYCISSAYFRRCTRRNLPLFENLLRLLHLSLFIEEVTDYDARFGLMVTDRAVRNKNYDLVVATVELLYNLSVESCIIDQLRALKEEDIPTVLHVLYQQSKKSNKHTTRFHCETLIGLIKDDIDNLEEPRELATSYVKYMSKAMNKEDHSFEKVRLSHVIIHLKGE
jgi:hypothetical protein